MSRVGHLVGLGFPAPPPASQAAGFLCPKDERSQPSTMIVHTGRVHTRLPWVPRAQRTPRGWTKWISTNRAHPSTAGCWARQLPVAVGLPDQSTSVTKKLSLPSPLRPLWKPRQNWIAVARCCPSSTVHGPGPGYRPGVCSIERSEAAASEWAGRAGLGGLKGEVEGYTSHGRNYFQEEVTCGPTWGTFQIPIPVSVCSWGKSLDPSALLDGHPR